MYVHTYVHYIHTYSIHTYIIAQRSVELLFVCPLAMPIGKFPELVDGTQRHSIVVVLVVAHAHTHTQTPYAECFMCVHLLHHRNPLTS